MEETLKDDSSSSATAMIGKSASKLLRYPLRSAAKSKEDKLPITDASISSAPRSRSQVTSSVSRSVSVLDLSGKEKSAKPPRRQSILSKSSVASPSSNLKVAGNVTPISGARPKKTPVKGDTTPVSDTLSRKKFSVLSSASYWVSQIKVSEAASKHSISLGFFRLALDAGCEPIQIIRDELKAYVRRHNLTQFEEQAKDLLASYNILEAFEQLQISETCSNVPEDETRSVADDIRSKTPNAKDTPNKVKTAKNEPVTKLSKPGKINAVKPKHGLKSEGDSQAKQRKPKSGDSDGLEKKGKSINEKDTGLVKSPVVEHELQENKENMDAGKTDELNQSEV